MPQLVPFYFLNTLTFGITAISFIVYYSSTFILPNMTRTYMSRTIVTKT
uniref:ATP synthase protein 8 n=1 Tax=Pichia sorbitophila (strain ATCC MYA-4447 / BCRC 22081 / CBS 7064 / NBRC 10061 / NRRL Y-12695) TaxID=559304 RepID=C7U011_PICSO|nr:ATP synthase subunit 8 [Millerozyma farinosa]CAY39292.1 ATP synthase, subunit 8 [Millerozyma farinosa]